MSSGANGSHICPPSVGTQGYPFALKAGGRGREGDACCRPRPFRDRRINSKHSFCKPTRSKNQHHGHDLGLLGYPRSERGVRLAEGMGARRWEEGRKCCAAAIWFPQKVPLRACGVQPPPPPRLPRWACVWLVGAAGECGCLPGAEKGRQADFSPLTLPWLLAAGSLHPPAPGVHRLKL